MEQGAQIRIADSSGRTPNEIWPVLEEIQPRLVEGCFHSISLENLEEDKHLLSFKSLGTLVKNGDIPRPLWLQKKKKNCDKEELNFVSHIVSFLAAETHQKILEVFFLSSEGIDRFSSFLSTGSLRLMAEIFKTFAVLLAGDQQNHFVKGTFVKIMLSALENKATPQVMFAFRFLEKLIEGDDQGGHFLFYFFTFTSLKFVTLN